VNLVEIVVFFVLSAVLCAGAAVGTQVAVEHEAGLAGSLLAGLAGGAGAVAALYLSVAATIRLWHMIFPLRPRCFTGRCRAKDYTWAGLEDRRLRWTCACGDPYLQTWSVDGGPDRFLRLDADGTEHRYMIRRRLRWERDDARDGGPPPAG
jgi:hypothetical protein